MISPIYRGSVKDLMGPIQVGQTPAVVFQYSDAYSVFDWGRMPDLLPHKGESLAVLAADWFEQLEKPETWKEFSRSPAALGVRKGNRFGSAFNEVGEKLQSEGLRTHYLGALTSLPSMEQCSPLKLPDVKAPFRHFAVRKVSVVKPQLTPVLGRSLPDYYQTRQSALPRLIPLEVIFRFSCPEGSSLIERTSRDPGYMASIGFPEYEVIPGARWEFPVLELFTKLESTDRPVTLGEALAISGLSGSQLQDLLFKTAWVAALLKSFCAKAGLELADGKLEWGMSETGDIFLVDAIGPDELRILKGGIQLSKEFLRLFYRETPWYQATLRAKTQAKAQGSADWKKWVNEAPPALPPQYQELASHLYRALANELSTRVWFPDCWKLDKVVDAIRGLKK